LEPRGFVNEDTGLVPAKGEQCMAVTAANILAIMKEAGIDEAIVDQLKPDVPLLRQGLDSIDLPIVAVATEKKYKLDLSHLDATRLRTINEFAAYLTERLGQKAGEAT
jgi:acyl carrier protein